MECDRDTEIGLLRKEKCQLEVCVANSTQESSNLEAKLEKQQSIILELQAQLSALQCELDELKVEYEKLADNSVKRIADLTDNYEKEIERLKSDFITERNELLIEIETQKEHSLNTLVKRNEIEETNTFLTDELEDVQRLYKDVRMLHTYIRVCVYARV